MKSLEQITLFAKIEDGHTVSKPLNHFPERRKPSFPSTHEKKEKGIKKKKKEKHYGVGLKDFKDKLLH